MTHTGNWNYPTTVRFGAGRIGELSQHARAAGMARPLFVTDPNLAKAQIAVDAFAALARDCKGAAVFSAIQPNPVGDRKSVV